MEKLNTQKVIEFAKKKGRFTTAQVASKFKATKMQAAACIAIMRIKEVVQRDTPGKTRSGSSRWIFTG